MAAFDMGLRTYSLRQIAATHGVNRASNLREGYRLEIVQKFTQPVYL